MDGTIVDSMLDIALSANFTRIHFGLSELPLETLTGYVGDGAALLQLLQRLLQGRADVGPGLQLQVSQLAGDPGA